MAQIRIAGHEEWIIMRILLAAALTLLSLLNTMAWAQLGCPGNKNKLSCEIPTTFDISNSTLTSIPSTVAAQLSQLPLAGAATGSGIIFSGGIPTVSTDTLGSILTERGDTLGKYNFYIAANYQRFGFDTIDGVHLSNFSAALGSPAFPNPNPATTYVVSTNRIDLTSDQVTVLGSVGLTDRVDLTLVVPFSKVTLKTQLKNGSAQYYFNPDTIPTDKNYGAYQNSRSTPAYNAGSASGIGDILLNVKANVIPAEKSHLALGAEVRFPTGDEFNFLGSGAYGFKPYLVFSRTGRVTPHVNFGYQWNSFSDLYPNPNGTGNLRLPDSLQYSSGVDVGVTKRLTVVGDWIGQFVIDGPRVLLGTQQIVGSTGQTPNNGLPVPPPIPPQCNSQWFCQTIQSKIDPNSNTKRFLTESYGMNNIAVGIKINVFRGRLLLTGNALIALDDGGLRSKVVPLVGISYRWNR
jgi:hypothetical protein